MNFKFLILIFLLNTSPAFGSKKIQIVTSIPDLAWVAAEIGGERIQSRSLLKGTENPHFVDAVPEFIRVVAEADIVCIVGLDLEIGYMSAVLRRSGNAKVQPGGNGYCETGKSVQTLEKPTSPVDRSMGDVHPYGNPHFYMSPKSLAEASKQIAISLKTVDPNNSHEYDKGVDNFQKKMNFLSSEITKILSPVVQLQNSTNKSLLMEYHREFTYFLFEYGLKSHGSLEDKPGVAPSAGRLVQVAESAKTAGVKIILAATYNPSAPVAKFSQLSQIKTLILPTLVQPKGKFPDYRDLQIYIAESIVGAIATGGPKN